MLDTAECKWLFPMCDTFQDSRHVIQFTLCELGTHPNPQRQVRRLSLLVATVPFPCDEQVAWLSCLIRWKQLDNLRTFCAHNQSIHSLHLLSNSDIQT